MNIQREKKKVHKPTYGMFVCAVEQVMNPGHISSRNNIYCRTMERYM